MTLYKCGHTRDTIILDDNIISYLAYLDWAESVGINGTKELCWDCWNEKNCKIVKEKDKIFDWSSYCATTNQRNQCSKETCTIFPICKFKEIRK
jgi:hypothetical protein